MIDKRPTIAELERILDGPNDRPITILPNGEIRVIDQPDTVYAHVERTVHALLDEIMDSVEDEETNAEYVKLLAESVSLLSSWPRHYSVSEPSKHLSHLQQWVSGPRHTTEQSMHAPDCERAKETQR